MMNYKEMVKIKNFNEKTPTKEWDDMLLEMAQIGNIYWYLGIQIIPLKKLI